MTKGQHSADAATIAMLIYDFRGSGVVRNGLRIAEAARAAGLAVELWPVRAQGELIGTLPRGVPVHALRDQPAAVPRALDSLVALPSLVRAIERRRPAVLFSTGNHAHFLAALAVGAPGRRYRPRLLGRASNAVVSAQGGSWRRLARPVERFQFAAMDRIVSVSEELTRAIATLALPNKRIDTIPNGTDLAAIAVAAAAPLRHPFFAHDAPPVVVAIGRLTRQKNFEGLLRAFAAARARRPLRLMILGTGSPARIARLRQLARRLGVEEDVSLEGFVRNPHAYLTRADLFVLSSRWEGASNVLLEALACGCPVVATKAPTGVAEMLLDGRIAPLVAVGDDEALGAAMLRRLDSGRDAHVLKRRAADFELSRTLDAYVRVLREECVRGSVGAELPVPPRMRPAGAPMETAAGRRGLWD